MTKELIRNWILEKKRYVYAIILKSYEAEYSSMGPKLFVEWLAKELGIPEDKISYQALVAVTYRSKKKKGKKPSPGEMKIVPATTEKKSDQQPGGKLGRFGHIDLDGPTMNETTGIDMKELEQSGFLKKKKS